MLETIVRLYRAGRLTESGVREAVRRGWITREQMDLMLKDPQMA